MKKSAPFKVSFEWAQIKDNVSAHLFILSLLLTKINANHVASNEK